MTLYRNEYMRIYSLHSIILMVFCIQDLTQSIYGGNYSILYGNIHGYFA